MFRIFGACVFFNLYFRLKVSCCLNYWKSKNGSCIGNFLIYRQNSGSRLYYDFGRSVYLHRLFATAACFLNYFSYHYQWYKTKSRNECLCPMPKMINYRHVASDMALLKNADDLNHTKGWLHRHNCVTVLVRHHFSSQD